MLIDSSAVKAYRCASGAKGERSRAVHGSGPTSRSRGGRPAKIHGATDRFRRPLAFLLSVGKVADSSAGALLLKRLPACRAIERMFCRLKDFRRVATRYDRLATNYLARRLPRRDRELLVMSPHPKVTVSQARNQMRVEAGLDRAS